MKFLSSDCPESKTRTNVDDKQHFSNKPCKSKFSEDPWPPNAPCTRPYKKRKLLGEKAGQISDEVGFGFRQDSGVKTVNKSVQVTRNLDPRQGKELEEIRNQLKKKCNK